MSMPITVRDVSVADLDLVRALNNSAGPTIFELNEALLERLYRAANCFRMVEVRGVPAGFLIALANGADYDSPNYRWFAERYPRFVYIDRVVVSADFRGHGLGRVLYADVQSHAERIAPVLTCEVSVDPRDEVSLLFHAANGFIEVGQQTLSHRGISVALMAKQLPAFDYVVEHYLNPATSPSS